MMSKVIIREARTDEFDNVERYGETSGGKRLALIRAKQKSEFLQGKRRIFFAEIQEEVVGMIHVRLEHESPDLADGMHCAHLGGLFVRQEYRRQGIGRMLMECAEDTMKKAGFLQLSLSMQRREQYNHLKKFYESCGYTYLRDAHTGMRDIWVKKI